MIIAEKVGIDAINKLETISMEGILLGGDCKLHFGCTTLAADSAELFFVTHPNKWGPFQKRFRDVLEKSNGAHERMTWAAGGAVASSDATAALTARVAAQGVGIPIGAVAGGVALVSQGMWDRLAGAYLRYVGPGN